MRDRQDIAREMFAARIDLEDRLAQLRRAFHAKVDLPARARQAFVQRAQRVAEAARTRPWLLVAVLGGMVVTALASAVMLRWRRRRPWYAVGP
jgi:hypothetical protein